MNRQEEIKEALILYYEIDSGNCLMTNIDWIEELSKALTDKDYLKKSEINSVLNINKTK